MTTELKSVRMGGEEKSQTCPECGGDLEFGVCPNCDSGAEDDGGDGEADPGDDEIE